MRSIGSDSSPASGGSTGAVNHCESGSNVSTRDACQASNLGVSLSAAPAVRAAATQSGSKSRTRFRSCSQRFASNAAPWCTVEAKACPMHEGGRESQAKKCAASRPQRVAAASALPLPSSAGGSNNRPDRLIRNGACSDRPRATGTRAVGRIAQTDGSACSIRNNNGWATRGSAHLSLPSSAPLLTSPLDEHKRRYTSDSTAARSGSGSPRPGLSSVFKSIGFSTQSALAIIAAADEENVPGSP